jgi:malonyl-CoA O-methyltransferase
MDFHARRFHRAAATYDTHAASQSRMAAALLSLWPAEQSAPESWVEFGCGTGILTEMLGRRFPHARGLATDAAEAMIEKAAQRLSTRSNLHFTLLDARDVVSAPEKFQIAASSAMLQWFPQPESHFHLVSEWCEPDALYLSGFFSKGNLPEFHTAFASAFPGLDRQVEPAWDTVLQAAHNAGWRPLRHRTFEYVERIENAMTALNRVRGLGSSLKPIPGMGLTRARLSKLLEELQKAAQVKDGLRLTWKGEIALWKRT